MLLPVGSGVYVKTRGGFFCTETAAAQTESGGSLLMLLTPTTHRGNRPEQHREHRVHRAGINRRERRAPSGDVTSVFKLFFLFFLFLCIHARVRIKDIKHSTKYCSFKQKKCCFLLENMHLHRPMSYLVKERLNQRLNTHHCPSCDQHSRLYCNNIMILSENTVLF